MNRKVVMAAMAAVLVFLAGCDVAMNPWAEDKEEVNWLETFLVKTPGEVRAKNTSGEQIAVFRGGVAKENLVGVLSGFENEYRLEKMNQGSTVLQAVRYAELNNLIRDPSLVEVASSVLVYVTGSEQYVSLSGGVTGDAELYVRNETDELVEVRRTSAGGEVLFAMSAGENRSVYLPSGSIILYPVAIVPVFESGQIRSYRSLELSESQNQFQLSVDKRVEYTIADQEAGTDVHGYVRVINQYHRGVQLRRGSETVYTALNELVVNPGGNSYYTFPLDAGEEERTEGSLQLTAINEVSGLGDVRLKRGCVIDITLTPEGLIVQGESQSQDNTVDNGANVNYTVGDMGPAGGIIFYDKGSVNDNWRYLEAAPTSAEWASKPWGGYGTLVGNTGKAVGDGFFNSGLIVAKYGNAEPYNGRTDYAAKLCADLVVGGKDDWFLPSLEELKLMYENLHLKNWGVFANDYYWSSSEFTAEFVRELSFSDGGVYGSNKYYYGRVRAVRAF